MMQPLIQIGCASNIYVRMMTFLRTGHIESNIVNDFDYILLLSVGSLKVTVEGIETTFDAPHMILIKAKLVHEFEALQDQTIAYQVYAIREMSTDNVLDPKQIPYESNPRLMSSRPL